MGKKSRDKGKVGEREVAKLLRDHGYGAYRGQQFDGSGGSPDVVHSIPNLHIEVKRTEAFRLYDALEQADGDSPIDKLPAVFHRKSRKDWVVVMNAYDFLCLIQEIQK